MIFIAELMDAFLRWPNNNLFNSSACILRGVYGLVLALYTPITFKHFLTRSEFRLLSLSVVITTGVVKMAVMSVIRKSKKDSEVTSETGLTTRKLENRHTAVKTLLIIPSLGAHKVRTSTCQNLPFSLISCGCFGRWGRLLIIGVRVRLQKKQFLIVSWQINFKPEILKRMFMMFFNFGSRT